MKEKISMQLQIPFALVIITLFPIVSVQALSDDATTTIGRQIQSEVEINLEVLNSLPSNDLSLGIVEVGKPKKSFTSAQEAKNAGADIVGSDELVEKVENGFVDFDRCISNS